MSGRTDKDFLERLRRQSSTELSVKEQWQATGETYSLSHIYYLIRKHDLPHKKYTATKPFQYLAALQTLDTKSMTIKQIMAKLNLTTRNQYARILDTLKKNGIDYKKEARNKALDFKLLSLDTAEMTIDEIAIKAGLQKGKGEKILYKKLPQLGLTYKSRSRK